MPVTWSDRYDPAPLLQRLSANKTVDTAGKPAFEGFAFHDCSALLYDMFIFPSSIPEREARGILFASLLALAAKPQLTRSSLLSELRKRCAKYASLSTRHFILTTTISLSPFDGVPPMEANGCKIRFLHHLPASFQEARKSIIQRAKQALFTDPPTGYLHAQVHVNAQSEYQAAETALDTFDAIRGIWNLYYNRQHSTRMSFGAQEPVNKIILGPLHSLHLPGGELATETFWFEPSYRAPVKAHRVAADLSKLRNLQRNTWTLLRASRYAPDLRHAIIKYARALDERDWHAAFLKMWGILESLTGTARDESYDVTIRRAAFVFSEHEYVTQVLKVLREQRNRLVHASASSEGIEVYLYQLKNFVEALLEFHLATKPRFESISQAGEFLSLPSCESTLRQRQRYIHRALKYKRFTPVRRARRAA